MQNISKWIVISRLTSLRLGHPRILARSCAPRSLLLPAVVGASEKERRRCFEYKLQRTTKGGGQVDARPPAESSLLFDDIENEMPLAVKAKKGLVS